MLPLIINGIGHDIEPSARVNLQSDSVGTPFKSREFYRELEQVVDLLRAALHREIYMLFTSGQQQRNWAFIAFKNAEIPLLRQT